MKIKYIIFIALIFYSCEEPPMSSCNTQNPLDDCYIESPTSVTIQSYSPSSIQLLFENQESSEDIESIGIERYFENNELDTAYTIHRNGSDYFIDTVGVLPENQYRYSVRYQNSDGESDAVEDVILHDFPGVDTLIVQAINDNSVNVSWEYDINDNFIQSYESMDWKLIKHKWGGDNWEEYPIEISEYNISNDNWYEYFDDQDISIDDSLQYTISLEIDNFESQLTSHSLKIDFPQLDSLLWIPMNSSAVGIYWDIGSADQSSGAISSVQIWNQFNLPGEFLYQGTENIGFFVDSLSNASSDISAGQQIEYTIRWCGLSDCDDSVFHPKTFPIHNMQYIPAIENIDFNGNTISSEAFYIDVYEVHQTIYDNPSQDNNFISPSLSLPIDLVTMDTAQDYCNQRSNAHSDEGLSPIYSNGNISGNLGFRLPYEYEWYIAAAILYDWIEDTTTSFEYTTQVGDGIINCSYGNILNCGGESILVGSYSGNNPDCFSCQKSTSPNGLYDCNGNLKEWAEQSNQYNHNPNQIGRGVLMGGDFESPASNAANNFFIYEDKSFSHSTIGFRTLIPAGPILNIIYNE